MPKLYSFLLVLTCVWVALSSSSVRGDGTVVLGQSNYSGWSPPVAYLSQAGVLSVHNSGSTSVTYRFYISNAQYTGPNCLHQENYFYLYDSYWAAHPTSSFERFMWPQLYTVGGSNPSTVSANSTNVSNDPRNFAGEVPWYTQLGGYANQPSSIFYYVSTSNPTGFVHFSERHNLVLQVRQSDGTYLDVQSQPVNFTIDCNISAPPGSAYSPYYTAYPQLYLFFDVAGNFKPVNSRQQAYTPNPQPPNESGQPAPNAPCPVCGPPAAPQNTVKSVDLQFKMGGDNFGANAGTLHYKQNKIDSSIYDPNYVIIEGLANANAVYNTSTNKLLQFLSQNDVVVVTDTSTTDQFFVLSFYTRNPSWTTDSNGAVIVSGTPHTVVTIQNPDRTFATTNKLQCTSVTPSKTDTWNYTWTAATNTWLMSSESGTHNETVVYTVDGTDSTITHEVRTVADEHGTLLSKVDTDWKNYDFGKVMIKQVVDPDGKALTTTWTYYDTSSLTSFGQVNTQTDPSGHWTTYSYDSNYEVNQTVEGYLNAPVGSANSLCKVTARAPYTASGAPANTSLETVTTDGIITSRKYVVEYPNGYDQIQCTNNTAAWNDATNLVTKIRYCSDAVFKTMPLSTINPDGTATFYSYSIDGTTLANSTVLTTVTSTGALNGAGTGISDGTQTTTQTNQQGGLINSQTVAIASGTVTTLVTDQQLTMSTDTFGRPTQTQLLDGHSTYTTYDCCGVSSTINEQGVTTTYATLTSSHTKTKASLGITWETVTSGLDTYQSRIGTDSTTVQLSHQTTNLAGQTIFSSTSTGGSATCDSSLDGSNQTVNTTTYADGGTMVQTLYMDGTLKSVTGTAVAPARYAYGSASDGTHWTQTILLTAAGADTSEWTKIWQDVAGRTFKVETSGTGTTLMYYNSLGQKSKIVDGDGVTTLFAYDSQGRLHRTVVDMNQNGTIDDGGTDRILQTDIAVTTRTGGRVVQRTTQTAWTTDSNATATAVLSTTDAAVDGLDAWVTANGVTAQNSASYPGTSSWTTTTTAGDGSTTVQTYTSGRLATVVQKDSTGTTISSTSYTYDPHGRISQTQDGHGAVTGYAYDSNDRVHSVTTPDPLTAGAAGPVTTYSYDSMSRQQTVTDTASGTVTYTYTPTGAVATVSGNRAYPISYGYTDQGRLATMTTSSGLTTWTYSTTNGLLTSKTDATSHGPSYTYTTGGRLLTKTNARGTVATYGYNNAGQVTTISYSDGITPAVTSTFNRLGQGSTVTANSITETLASNAWNQLQSDSFSGGPLNGLSITYAYDSLSRASSLTAVLGSTLTSQTYGYDSASRLSTVTSGANVATYGYDASAGELLTQTAFTNAGSTVMTSERTYDLARRLSSIKTLNATGGSMLEADYTYNSLNQRTGMTREDSTQWTWGYNDRGEVTSGSKLFSDSTPEPQLQYSYTYDALGNRTSYVKGASDSAHTSTYTPNSLNQYSSRTVPPYLSVTGQAASDAHVVVQAQPASRKGSEFWKEWSEDNSSGPVRENVRVIAAKPGAGTGGTDQAALQTGKLYLPPATETFTYDLDGNLTADSRWTYTWDAENRLLSMEETSATLPTGWVRQRLEFTYTPDGRRLRKTVKTWSGSAWTVSTDLAFAYDGWNLIAELDLTGASPTLVCSYCWGLDLSGTTQGAGGVGGLLSAQSLSGAGTYVHYPTYDGNGNIIGYVDALSGNPVIRFDYDSFGFPVTVASLNDSTSSTIARGISLRFSSKFLDRETGLNYYGFRYYRAELGRWLNNDPIGVNGGYNLYALNANDAINKADLFGLAPNYDGPFDGKHPYKKACSNAVCCQENFSRLFQWLTAAETRRSNDFTDYWRKNGTEAKWKTHREQFLEAKERCVECVEILVKQIAAGQCVPRPPEIGELPDYTRRTNALTDPGQFNLTSQPEQPAPALNTSQSQARAPASAQEPHWVMPPSMPWTNQRGGPPSVSPRDAIIGFGIAGGVVVIVTQPESAPALLPLLQPAY